MPAKGFELQQLYRLINRFRGQARSYNGPSRLQRGRGRFDRHQICGVTPDAFPAKAGPTR